MLPLTQIPAIIGASCGLLLFPITTNTLYVVKRWQNRLEDEKRLKQTTFILSGTLAEKNIVKNLDILNKEKRQGVLHIFTGRRKGYILFRGGEAIDAFYRNSTGIEALKMLLKIEDGDYFFESRAVYQPDLIRRSLLDMIKNS